MRHDVRPFTADLADAAGELIAQRHARHRLAFPALDPAFAEPATAARRVAELCGGDVSSGAAVFRGSDMVAYALGYRKADPPWGPNIWVEDAGCAATDVEAMRVAYAVASARWRDEGATQQYAIVPATDDVLIEAWFSMTFGLQQVHALRESVTAAFAPSVPAGVTIRPAERADIPMLAELDLVLPRHTALAPVFSILPVPALEATIQELEEDFGDPRFTTLVAEHDGRVVASATACSLELSGSNTPLMRPVSCGFLGYAAVLPDARGLGAGRALGEAVLAWSRDEGYEWVATDWRSTNIEANRTWRALGFEPSFLRLNRVIP